MTWEPRILQAGDQAVLANVAPGVLDHPLDPRFVAEGLGCRKAWTPTDRSNDAAMRLYASTGGREAPADQVMFTFFLGR